MAEIPTMANVGDVLGRLRETRNTLYAALDLESDYTWEEEGTPGYEPWRELKERVNKAYNELQALSSTRIQKAVPVERKKQQVRTLNSMSLKTVDDFVRQFRVKRHKLVAAASDSTLVHEGVSSLRGDAMILDNLRDLLSILNAVSRASLETMPCSADHIRRGALELYDNYATLLLLTRDADKETWLSLAKGISEQR